MPLDIDELLNLAIEAAKAAADTVHSYENKNIKVDSKDSGNSESTRIVTEVDLKVQERILEIINPSIRKYKLGLLTEESIDDKSRLECEYFWSIDPIDGTLAFSKDLPGYSTSIALVSKQGDAILGVVYDLVNKNIYHAVKESGAFKNNLPLLKSKNNLLSIYYDQSYTKHPEFKNHISQLESSSKKHGLNGVEHCSYGAVMNAISTIENAPALYYKYPKSEEGGGSIWDFAATSLIHSEAGCFNSDFNGTPIPLNRKSSTYMNDVGIRFLSDQNLIGLIPNA